MIKTAVFDLEDVLAVERPFGNLIMNPVLAPHFERLHEEGYDIFMIRRRSEGLFATVREEFARFHSATVLCQEGKTLKDQHGRASLAKLLSANSIDPTTSYYFYNVTGLISYEDVIYRYLVEKLNFSGALSWDLLREERCGIAVSSIFRYKIFGEPAVSEDIALTPEELRLSCQLLSMLSLRMCNETARLGKNSGWRDYLDAVVASRCSDKGLNASQLTERDYAGIVKDLGATAKYDPERLRRGGAGSLMCHYHMSAFERAVSTLEYWDLLWKHSGAHFEMKVGAADIFAGNHASLKQGNRHGFANALCDFLFMEKQVPWGHWDILAPKEFDVVVPEDVIDSFHEAGLTEHTPDGLVWSDKIEPYFDYGGCELFVEPSEYFQAVCGKMNREGLECLY